MSRIPSVLKFPLVLSGAILILFALVSRSSLRKKDRFLGIERPPATAGYRRLPPATAWSHDKRMRLYPWAIINGSLSKCNSVLDAGDKNNGRTPATVSAYSVKDEVVKVRRYRVDQLPSKPRVS